MPVAKRTKLFTALPERPSANPRSRAWYAASPMAGSIAARRIRAPRQFHPAALAAAAGVDLGLDDREALAGHQLARGGDGFLLRLDQLAAGDGDAVSAQDLLGLVLVDLHGGRLSTPHRRGAQARVGARTSSVSSGSRFYAAQLRRVPTRLSNCGASTGRLRWYPCA